MPAYEYECNTCGCHFERRQKMSEDVIRECPECGGAVRRLISGGAGAITKGTAGSASAGAQPSCCLGGGCCGQMGSCEGAGACER